MVICIFFFITKKKLHSFATKFTSVVAILLHHFIVLPKLFLVRHTMEKTISKAEVEEFEEARRLTDIYEPALRFSGLWILEPPGLLHFCWIIPYIVHSYFGVLYLFDVWPKLEPVCGNLTEFLLHFLFTFRFFYVRYSKSLPKLLQTACDEIRADYFGTVEERKRYLEYNVRAKNFASLMMKGSFTVSAFYYAKPLVIRIVGNLSGAQNMTYMLPYRIHLFFDYAHPKIYWPLYLVQSVNWFINMSLASTQGIIITLTFHCCGQLYALQYRIGNMCGRPNMDDMDVRECFKSVVEEHIKLKEMGQAIDAALRLLMLEELVVLTLTLAISSFCAVLNITNIATSIPMTMLSCILTLIIYECCYIGEALITESLAVNAAFSECSWCDTPETFKKSLIICIAGSANPIQLTGGGMCVYSLFQFTDILKSAGAYLSMLRNFV